MRLIIVACSLIPVLPPTVAAQDFRSLVQNGLQSWTSMGGQLQLGPLQMTPMGGAMMLSGEATLAGSPVGVRVALADGTQLQNLVVDFRGGTNIGTLQSLAGAANLFSWLPLGLENVLVPHSLEVSFGPGNRVEGANLLMHAAGSWRPLGDALIAEGIQLALFITNPGASSPTVTARLDGNIDVGGVRTSLTGMIGTGEGDWTLRFTPPAATPGEGANTLAGVLATVAGQALSEQTIRVPRVGGPTSVETVAPVTPGSRPPPAVMTPPPAPAVLDQMAVCADAVQGRIAWDYQGNRSWATANLERLCTGTSNGTQPASCFERTMHGGINWGGGTQWRWENALDLCEGTNDANATIRCFQEQLSRTGNWSAAIRACEVR